MLNQDIALIQEPYRNFVKNEDYTRVKLGNASKTEIWIKKE